jgi:hypothetical protein
VLPRSSAAASRTIAASMGQKKAHRRKETVGLRGLEEEPLASQHPDPGVQESSHLIESGRDGLGRWVAGPLCQQYQRNRYSSLIRRLHGLDELTGPGTPFRENPECGRKWHIHTVHSFGR